MRGLVALSSSRYKFKQVYPTARALGSTMSTSTPKKQEANICGDERLVGSEKMEPIVSFSRPPQPPLLGPVIAAWLLEMWSSRDGEDG